MLLNPRNFHWFLFLWTSFEDITFKKILKGLQDVFLKIRKFGNMREISTLGMLNQSKKCPKFQHKIGNFGLFSKKCCTIFLNLYELLVFNKTKQITEEKNSDMENGNNPEISTLHIATKIRSHFGASISFPEGQN